MDTDADLEISVRQAIPADLDTVVEFNADLARESEGKTLDLERLRKGVVAVLDRDDRGFYLVAEAAGRVVGQLLITTEWSDWRNGFFWWIQSVYVAPDYRRRGVYRVLEGHVRSLAKQRGDVCGLRLYVERDNRVAQQVYSNLNMRRSHYDLFEIDFDFPVLNS